MIEKLFKRMIEEKDDFYHYLKLFEECTDTSVRSKLHSIASQEMQHYKELYDIVFKEDAAKTWSPLEHALSCEAKEWYEEMTEEIKQVK